MSYYPLISWAIDLEGVGIDVTANSVQETLTFPAAAATTWGWGADSAGDAASDSLAGRLATLLVTHSEITAASATYAAGKPGTYTITVTSGGVANISIKGAVDTLRRLGLYTSGTSGTDTLTFALVTGVVSDCHFDGAWMPGVPAADAEPTYVDPGTSVGSPYDPGTWDRLSWTARRVWSVTWPYVESADMSRDYVAYVDAGFSTLANREALDTYGTFDDVLIQTAAGADLRLVLAMGTERDVRFVEDGDLDRSRYANRETVGGRRWNVVIALLETSEATP